MNYLVNILTIWILALSTCYANSDISKDMIVLYRLHEESSLADSINIYSNKELKGSPYLIIQKDKILMGKSEFNNKDVATCKKKNDETNECLDTNNPVDFLTHPDGTIKLIVENKEDDVFTVRDKGKEYFLKMSVNSFKDKRWPDLSIWKSYSNKTGKELLNKILVEDKVLNQLFEDLKKCIENKSIECLIKHEEGRPTIARMFKYRKIADTPNLCKEFLKLDSVASWDDLDEISQTYKVSNSEVVWKKMSEVLNFNRDEIFVKLLTEKFESPSFITLEKVVDTKLDCENTKDLSIKFQKIKNASGKYEWKIVYMTTYDSPPK